MGKWGKTLSSLVLGGTLAAGLGVANAAVVIQEGYNEAAPPDFLVWGLNEVGWYWTPQSDFSLTGIRTSFRSGTGVGGDVDRDVTIVLMDDRGGAVLASGVFNSSAARGTLGGITFGTAYDVDDATTYFVGFQNVLSLGINIVGNTPNDESFDALGPSGYGDNDGVVGNFASAFAGDPQFESTCIALGCPIIAFLTEIDDPGENGDDIPEPATLLLFSVGLLGFGTARWRRTH